MRHLPWLDRLDDPDESIWRIPRARQLSRMVMDPFFSYRLIQRKATTNASVENECLNIMTKYETAVRIVRAYLRRGTP